MTSSSSAFGYTYGGKDPTLAFKHRGIEFWGSAKTNLDKMNFNESDLIVNLTGMSYVVKPFITNNGPKWFNVQDKFKVNPEQIVLDWKDFGVPPDNIDLEFWEDIIDQAQENNIKRIICCCGAGQGRTGTALAVFALACNFADEPSDAIDYIRKNYSDDAIETQSQVVYVYKAIYNIDDLYADDIYQSIKDRIKVKTTTHYSSYSYDKDKHGVQTAIQVYSPKKEKTLQELMNEDSDEISAQTSSKKIHGLTEKEWEDLFNEK